MTLPSQPTSFHVFHSTKNVNTTPQVMARLSMPLIHLNHTEMSTSQNSISIFFFALVSDEMTIDSALRISVVIYNLLFNTGSWNITVKSSSYYLTMYLEKAFSFQAWHFLETSGPILVLVECCFSQL